MLNRALLFIVALMILTPAAAGARTRELNDYGRLIRVRNADTIARIPKKILNDDELKKYLQEVSLKVEEHLSPATKGNAGLIIEGVRRKSPNAAASANTASGCVMAGHLEEALLIMGKICREDPSSADNLNNYAAFLTMAGGGQAAIPILAKLNQQFPDNSTVLNNLGQAWFGLGDLEEAEKHLDAAIRIFPHHPQANYTKSIIEGSRGNKAAAIAALKASLQSTFGEDRANRLEKLGGTIDFQADLGFHMPQDALGLNGFVIPPFPKSTAALEDAVGQWESFRKQCHAAVEKLDVKLRRLDKELADKNAARQKRMQELLKSMDQAGLKAFAREEKRNTPPFMRKALAKLVMMEEDGETRIRKDMEMSQKLDEVRAETSKLKEEWQRLTDEGYERMQKKGADVTECEALALGLGNTYLPAINRLWEDYNNAFVDRLRKTTNSQAYFGQYTTPGGDVAVEAMETRLKRNFLSELAGLNVAFWEVEHDCSGFVPLEGGGAESSTAKKNKSSGGKLQDFNDLHCDHHVSLEIPLIGSIEVECNKMTSKLEALPFLKGEWTEDLDTNELINGTVLLGASTELGSKKFGPLKAEGKIGGGVFLEFDGNGITDVGPYGEIKAEIGANLGEGRDPYHIHLHDGHSISGGDLAVGDAGVEVRYGWNSGFEGKGVGVLEGFEF
jgi:tetratricopeptide (TPR) repeat protein